MVLIRIYVCYSSCELKRYLLPKHFVQKYVVTCSSTVCPPIFNQHYHIIPYSFSLLFLLTLSFSYFFLLFLFHISPCQFSSVCFIVKVSFKLVSAVHPVRCKRSENKKQKYISVCQRRTIIFWNLHLFPLLLLCFVILWVCNFMKKKNIFFCFWNFSTITEKN